MLQQKHLTAMQLLLDGSTYNEVASAVNVNANIVSRWVAGDATLGKVAVEFSEQYKKLKKTQASETNDNLSFIRLRLSKRLKEWVGRLKFPMSQDNMDYAIDIMKVLKEPPQRVDITQIYNMQFQSGEDIVHEFKRLNALAGDGTFASDRGSVQKTKGGRPASIPLPPEGRGLFKKTGKGNTLQSKPEAGSVSPESSED